MCRRLCPLHTRPGAATSVKRVVDEDEIELAVAVDIAQRQFVKLGAGGGKNRCGEGAVSVSERDVVTRRSAA